MQQVFAEFKKMSVEEMDTLRRKNVSLKWRVEVEGKGKEKETSENVRSRRMREKVITKLADQLMPHQQ